MCASARPGLFFLLTISVCTQLKVIIILLLSFRLDGVRIGLAGRKKLRTSADFARHVPSYKRGSAPKQGYLDPMIMGAPMERLSVDITGPHPTSSGGHKYISTVVDHFSKWAEAFPIRNQEAQTVAKMLIDRVFTYIGMPMQILSDQGKNFESELFKEMCKCLGIEKIRTTIYKPSTKAPLSGSTARSTA